MLKVYKFGGASVKDADAVRNVAAIIKKYAPEELVVVVSAMGKTTNALEKVLNAWYEAGENVQQLVDDIIQYHQQIIASLFPQKQHPVYFKTDLLFGELEGYVSSPSSLNYDYDYDQLVSLGEVISSTIISEYLGQEGLNCVFADARELIRTDDTWREGKVDWEKTGNLIKEKSREMFKQSGDAQQIILTQGFIGSTGQGETTTLGREGSDYTAAIFSFVLDAVEMTVWKDVPGLLNADPKYYSVTKRLDSISYHEAIELSYYGATVIHPKTIKPLQNKNIPLRIRSFVDPENQGSIIDNDTSADSLIPSFIFKVNQVLVSITPRDFSFIDELSLSEILAVFARYSIHISLMQNSAISFSVCIDHNERKLNLLFSELNKNFKIRYNTGLELITVRHYDQATIDRIMEDRKAILLEMRSRITAQFVARPL